jgi:predicted ATP-grasp superfamily ATP-dependent carboligase
MFGLGGIVGKIITAPLKILDIPNKIINTPVDKTAADTMAEEIEDAIKDALGDD